MKKRHSVMVFILIVTMLVTLTPSVMAEAETITIYQAIDLALVNSPDIKKAQNTVDLADINELNSKIAYNSAYTRWAGTNFNNSGYQADDKAKRLAWEGAQDSLGDAKKSMDNTRETVKYNVESQYLTLLNNENQIKVLAKTVAKNQTLVKIEMIKNELGLSTAILVGQAQIRLESSQNQLKSLKDSLSTLYWVFNRTIGKDTNNQVTLSPVAFTEVNYNEDTQDSTKSAKNVSLALTQYNRTVTKKQNDIADIGSNSSEQTKLLEVQIGQTELSINDTNYNIEVGIKTAFEKMNSAQKNLFAAKNAYDVAKINYDQLKLQYDLGMIAKVSLDDLDITLDQALNSYEKATYDFYLATRELALAQKSIFVSSK